jgi:PPM family protein phosphatase
MNFDVAASSEKGPRRRNEDAAGAWVVSPSRAGLVVADGVGGHVGGQRASSLALNKFHTYISGQAPIDLEGLANAIHAEIRKLQLEDAQFETMATTFSAVVVDGTKMQTVHCGDTRIVLQRGQGIRRLTEDHTEAQRFLTEGLLSREEYDSYPRKNVLDSALGVRGSPRIDSLSRHIEKGDRIFITSDGLHAKIMLRELKRISDSSSSAEQCVNALMLCALKREPDDNFSVSALFVQS